MAPREPKPPKAPSGASSKRTAASASRAKNRPRTKRGKRRRSWLIPLLAFGVFMGAVGLLGAVGVLAYHARDLPTIEAVRNYNPPQITRILDRKGRVIGQFANERRTIVPLERVPRVLVLSVLAAEDSDFYRHAGLDYTGIARAILRDLVSGRKQGASTITQQIVKNLLLTPERTISRKIKEWILAVRLERELSKDEILYLYLNHINFGHGRYGVQEAARFYFGKDVADLNLSEASLIAGIPQAPARLSPVTHPEAAKRRQHYVLGQLAQKRAEYWPDLALEDIEVAKEHSPKLTQRGGNALDSAPELLSYVKRQLQELVGEEAAERGGYTVRTTLDLDLQTQVRASLQKGLRAIDERHGMRGPLKAPRRKSRQEKLAALKTGRTYDAVVTGADDAQGLIELDVGGHRAVAEVESLTRFNPKRLSASQFAAKGARMRASVQSLGSAQQPARVQLELGPEGAVVVIDPRTREVLAMVGGYAERFGFNRATQAVRQPGSTFKPLVYGVGLRSRRFTPASLLLDAPEVFEQWQPSNYETWHYEGAVRLRDALARSINLVAVRLIHDIGPAAVVSFARELGITSKLEPNLSLALGSSDVRPVELTNAYAAFAAGGRWEPYRLIQRIDDPEGHPVALPRAEPARDVMTPAEAYLLTNLLTSVVQDGTASAAKKLGRPAAGKTGTSNDARDAWFVGYTPQTVVGVWVGYDDDRSLGRRETGGKAALPIWMDVIEAAEKGRPAVDFARPNGLETALIDPKSGLLAYEGMPNTVQELFLEGTVPTEMAARPDELDANSFMMEQLGELAPQVEDMELIHGGVQAPSQRPVEKRPLPIDSLLKSANER